MDQQQALALLKARQDGTNYHKILVLHAIKLASSVWAASLQ
jgi:hypothetical protein